MTESSEIHSVLLSRITSQTKTSLIILLICPVHQIFTVLRMVTERKQTEDAQFGPKEAEWWAAVSCSHNRSTIRLHVYIQTGLFYYFPTEKAAQILEWCWLNSQIYYKTTTNMHLLTHFHTLVGRLYSTNNLKVCMDPTGRHADPYIIFSI